jgi:glucose-6-phosphate 1-dehydrogenase
MLPQSPFTPTQIHNEPMTTSELAIELDDQPLANSESDAFVFFGATGDLAHKKIFPALHNMVRHGTLNVPVIGLAKSEWTIDQFRNPARDGIEKFGGGVDESAFARLMELLRYIDGEYGTQRPSPPCGSSLKRRSARLTTSPFHPVCSRP